MMAPGARMLSAASLFPRVTRYRHGMHDSTTVDQVIHASWIIPVQPDGEVLSDHAVVLADGRIAELLPAPTARQKYAHVPAIELESHVLIPGLVNAHTHAAMSLFKGLADDMPLMTWLNDHIWPAESKWVSETFVRDGTQLAAAEMLLGGTTCFNDMYFFPTDAALAAQDTGIRIMAGLIVLDFPTVWAGKADEYLSKAIQVHDRLRDEERIYTAFAPHAPYTVSDKPLERVRTLSDELDIPVHIHVHETAFEVEDAKDRSGKRPLRRLEELGLLSDRLLAVHMTQLEDSEIEAVAAAGTHVIHCPESNMKLASGACPVAALLEAGVKVALGTDGAASNNDLSMLGEARSASMLGKLTAGDAGAVTARQSLHMATLGGARALGLESELGSLESGKCADIVAIDLSGTENQPVYDPLSHVIYSASAQHVSHVWVAGRQLVENGLITSVDRSSLLNSAKLWQQRIAGAAPVES